VNDVWVFSPARCAFLRITTGALSCAYMLVLVFYEPARRRAMSPDVEGLVGATALRDG
jgi:hypothetical protein